MKTSSLLVLLALAACNLNAWDAPIQPVPSPYGPCGATWTSCRPVAKTCCMSGYVCPSTADGVCEDVGNELRSSVDGGARKTMPMRAE